MPVGSIHKCQALIEVHFPDLFLYSGDYNRELIGMLSFMLRCAPVPVPSPLAPGYRSSCPSITWLGLVDTMQHEIPPTVSLCRVFSATVLQVHKYNYY